MSEDQKMLLLSPEDGGEHTEDSVLIDATCGCRAWISPSGLTFLANNPDAQTTCMRCMDPLAMAKSLAKHGLIAPAGAVESVEKHMWDNNEQMDPITRLLLRIAKEQS